MGGGGTKLEQLQASYYKILLLTIPQYHCDVRKIRTQSSPTVQTVNPSKCNDNTQISSSAISETPRCRVGQFWPKVEDDILQTIYSVCQKHADVLAVTRESIVEFSQYLAAVIS